MKVFVAREHVMDEGSTTFGIFSNPEAAIACLKGKEKDGGYSGMEDGEPRGKVVWERTDGCFSLQVLVYEVQN
jgi:hypothetical protein